MDEYEDGERLDRTTGQGRSCRDSDIEREALEVGLCEDVMGKRLLDEAVFEFAALRV